VDTVWIVNRPEEIDGLYAFVDEHRAREFADRYGDAALVSQETVMSDSAAAQFLIDNPAEDRADSEGYDHSRAKEDTRNAYLASLLTDAQALDEIAHILRDPDWGVGMLEDFAELVQRAGRDTANLPGDEPTWGRH